MSRRWSVDVNSSLQTVFDDPACPQGLRQMLAGALSWQVRNETSVRKTLLSPRIAPQWVVALLAFLLPLPLRRQVQPLKLSCWKQVEKLSQKWPLAEVEE